MKHLVPNPELKEKIYPDFDVTFLSCQFDDGKFAQHVDPLRLGADGMEVWIFPCQSCLAQMKAFILEPMVRDAVREPA